MFSRADECPSDRYWITTSRAGERNIKERDGPGGATPNAHAQRRAANPPPTRVCPNNVGTATVPPVRCSMLLAGVGNKPVSPRFQAGRPGQARHNIQELCIWRSNLDPNR
jgi:hypothetical protein